MLLNAENLLDPLWWSLWFIVTALKTSVTVREIDRRVLLVHVAVEVGLITRVWGPIGQAARHSTPVSGGTGVYSTSFQRG